MADTPMYKMSKQRLYKLSLYLNVVLVIIIGVFFYLLIRDSMSYGQVRGDTWLYIARDVAFLSISLTIVFIQLFRNLWTIMRRTL
jgi:hypothetical protein